jgi:glycerol uptake facilitator protein
LDYLFYRHTKIICILYSKQNKTNFKMNIFLQEIMGTMLLLLLGNGVVANVVLDKTKGNNSGWIVITLGWAMAVFVAAAAIGGHLNPAVTVAFMVNGTTPVMEGLMRISGEMLGAMLGSTLVWLYYHNHYESTDDAGAKLATFCTSPAIRNTLSNVLGEIIGTFVLMFAILRFANASGLGAVSALPIALTVLAIGLCLGGTTGYAINPARDLGSRIMHAILPISRKGGSDWSYAWIPVLAPIAGAVLAVLVNSLLLS